MNIVLERCDNFLCPICAKPLSKEFKVVDYREDISVLVCKKHYTGGENGSEEGRL